MQHVNPRAFPPPMIRGREGMRPGGDLDSRVPTDWKLLKVIAICLAVVVVVQICLGADMLVVAGLCFAVMLGVLASAVAGGIRTVVGALCFIHVLKVLLVALLLKSILLETLESNLLAPWQTSVMLICGYGSLLLACLALRVMFAGNLLIRRGLFKSILPRDPQFLLALGLTMAIAGAVFTVVGGRFIGQAGGGLGFIKSIAGMKGFSVACFVFYAHAKGWRHLLLNPLVVVSTMIISLLGVLSASKQGILEPVLLAGMSYYAIRGFEWKRYLSVGVVCYLVAQYIINPFTQNAKMTLQSAGYNASAREMLSFFVENATNSAARKANIAKIDEMEAFSHKTYFDTNVYMLSRATLVYEQSWLVAASVDPESRSGWFTIKWAFEMVMPSFIMPYKPAGSAAPWLGSFSGVTGIYDDSTSISFGYMANLYNAFGNIGVLIGGFLIPFVLFAMIVMTFGYGLHGGIFWVLGIVSMHHIFVEAVISSLLPIIYVPLYFLVYYCLARILYLAMKS